MSTALYQKRALGLGAQEVFGISTAQGHLVNLWFARWDNNQVRDNTVLYTRCSDLLGAAHSLPCDSLQPSRSRIIPQVFYVLDLNGFDVDIEFIIVLVVLIRHHTPPCTVRTLVIVRLRQLGTITVPSK